MRSNLERRISKSGVAESISEPFMAVHEIICLFLGAIGQDTSIAVRTLGGALVTLMLLGGHRVVSGATYELISSIG